MIPKIIHHTSNLHSWEERRVIGEAKNLMPEFQFKFWNDDDNAALVEKYFPQFMDQYNGFKSGVIRTDIARCLYLYESGGIYADTDYRFFKPLDDAFLSNYCVLGIEERGNKAVGGGDKIGNAFMAAAPSFDLWPEFVESIFERSRNGEDRVVFLGGPHALSIFLAGRKDFIEKITVMPPEAIYPAFRMAKLKTYRDETTIGGHLCWGSWRNKSMIGSIKSRMRRVLSAIL